MFSARNLLMTLGVCAAAVATALNLAADRARRRESRLQRVELQRWEDEGGNALLGNGARAARARARRR